MIVKLVDLYNTKFFYKTFCTDLNYLFTSMVRLSNHEEGFYPNEGNELLASVYKAVQSGEEVVIDLADARLTSDALGKVYWAEENGVMFCDTLSEWRDTIFKENRKRKILDAQDTVPLPIFGYRTDIKEYIKNLDNSVVYDCNEQPVHIMIAVVCIATILRPSVKIRITRIVRQLFKYINTKVPTSEILDSDEFYMQTNEGVQIVHKDNIYVQEAQAVLSVKDALQHAVLVPTKFGREVLLNNPNYNGLFRSCLLMLQEFQEGSSKTLEEIYG